MYANMRIRTKSALFGAIIVIASVLVTTTVVLVLMHQELTSQAQDHQNVKMRLMQDLVRSKGEPRIVDGKLAFGTYIVNDQFDIVDKVRDIAGGTATIFQGDIRVSTNVPKEDGTRALGTLLTGSAKDATLNRAQPYRGEADILGVPYFTAYEPIIDSQGRTLGVLYVGVKQEEFFRSFQRLRLTAVGIAAGLALVFGLVVSFVMGRLLKRLSALSTAADQVSMGNQLDAPLVSRSEDEIGDLTRSIDRLRQSMRIALKNAST